MARIVPPTKEWLQEAARILWDGGLVAMPTETVYGLAANACNAEAVAKIFAVKGRPATNPLIVHFGRAADIEMVARLDRCRSLVEALAAEFWPGPLTLVLPSQGNLPPLVTAGQATVAVRVPGHIVAIQLQRWCDLPLAAPSANRSEEVSPTRPEHVAESLGDAVDLILDGGPCQVGLESTVLSLVDLDAPTILRPGAVTAEQIARVTGRAPIAGAAAAGDGSSPLSSPGQMRRHYAPATPLYLTGNALIDLYSHHDVGLIARNGEYTRDQLGQFMSYRLLPADPEGYARELYDALREMDANPRIGTILLPAVPNTPEWLAVRDRLARAAAK